MLEHEGEGKSNIKGERRQSIPYVSEQIKKTKKGSEKQPTVVFRKNNKKRKGRTGVTKNYYLRRTDSTMTRRLKRKIDRFRTCRVHADQALGKIRRKLTKQYSREDKAKKPKQNKKTRATTSLGSGMNARFFFNALLNSTSYRFLPCLPQANIQATSAKHVAL